jgi:hypothetical protein
MSENALTLGLAAGLLLGNVVRVLIGPHGVAYELATVLLLGFAGAGLNVYRVNHCARPSAPSPSQDSATEFDATARAHEHRPLQHHGH